MPENLKPRQSAVRILSRVLNDQKTVDAAIFEEKDYTSYSDSDRHFIKLLNHASFIYSEISDGTVCFHATEPIEHPMKPL